MAKLTDRQLIERLVRRVRRLERITSEHAAELFVEVANRRRFTTDPLREDEHESDAV